MRADMIAAGLAAAGLILLTTSADLSSAEFHRPRMMPGAVDCTLRKIKSPFLKPKLRDLEAALRREVKRQQAIYDARHKSHHPRPAPRRPISGHTHLLDAIKRPPEAGLRRIPAPFESAS